jgi:hypothetical protein
MNSRYARMRQKKIPGIVVIKIGTLIYLCARAVREDFLSRYHTSKLTRVTAAIISTMTCQSPEILRSTSSNVCGLDPIKVRLSC